MYATRGEIDDSLDDLEDRLPKLVRDHGADDDFWAVFHAYADPILEDSGPADIAYARGRVQGMLADRSLDGSRFAGVEPERNRSASD